MADVVLLPAILNDRRIMRAPQDNNGTSPSRVRRSLFGRERDSREFARRELRLIEEEQRKRWNFNFETGEPVEGGRFSWTRVEADERVHASYALCRLPFCGKGGSQTDSSDAKDPASPLELPSTSATRPADDASSGTTTTVLKQTSMSDFMKIRKRSLPLSKSAESSPKAAKVQRTLSS